MGPCAARTYDDTCQTSERVACAQSATRGLRLSTLAPTGPPDAAERSGLPRRAIHYIRCKLLISLLCIWRLLMPVRFWLVLCLAPLLAISAGVAWLLLHSSSQLNDVELAVGQMTKTVDGELLLNIPGISSARLIPANQVRVR